MNENVNCNTKRLYVRYSGGISQQSVLAFQTQILQRISLQGFNEIYLCLSSNGGSVNSGIEIYNFLKSLKNIKIITHNVGMVASIANVVFIAGQERYANQGTSFLIHGVKIVMPTNMEFSIYSLKEIVSNLERDEERIEDIYKNETSLSHDEIKQLFQAGESKNCDYAKEHKIIADIKDLSISTKDALVNIIATNNGEIMNISTYNC